MDIAFILPTESPLNLGIVVIAVALLGYTSNWLNWQFLNHLVTRLSYYIGAFVHETSHAVFCVLTGAKIHEYVIFSSQPHVTHSNPRLPLIGPLLIGIAPIIGGLTFLFAVNEYVLADSFTLPAYTAWSDTLTGAWQLLVQVNLGEWQGWALLVLFLNAGAMLGPSFQDLKNFWPMLIVLLFVEAPLIASIGLLAASLILVNIAIQIAAIIVIRVAQLAMRAF